MDVLTWSGNNASPRSFSGLNFSPDFVWIKCKSDAAGHALYDTVRGVGNSLESNITGAEVNNSQFGYLSAFNSDGFTALTGTYPGYEFGAINMTGRTYVGWCWDAGTSTVSNTQGSITSQVRANATAGLSVVSFTGNGVQGATIGHGCGTAPEFIILKKRTGVADWEIYHSALGAGKGIEFTTGAAFTSNAYWPSTPTSSVISLGNNSGINASGADFIVYAFSPVVGYSNFGSYVGNGLADGPFVYTGFRPKWVMIKPLYSYDGGGSTVASTAWYIYDSVRGTYNANGAILGANNAYAEENNATDIDFLSNGFKLRNTRAINTTSGAIYAAFAEMPFNYSRAR